MAVSFLMLGASGAFAGKPAGTIAWSNGFPSGEHYNLNIHGKKEGYSCDGSAGGASIFVPEHGTASIEFIQNKRSTSSNLSTPDACGGFDGDAAQVLLPTGEYQVYARILAKPQKADETREVVFYPKLAEACDDSGTANFSTAVSCDESFLLGTGVITSGGVFDLESQELVRSSGKSKAVDITDLFAWSGYACDQSYDTNANGEIDLGDVAADLDGDGLIDADDLALYLAASCEYHESEWVFNIADLVVYGWDYHNSGSKLVQVRFYPTASTTYG